MSVGHRRIDYFGLSLMIPDQPGQTSIAPRFDPHDARLAHTHIPPQHRVLVAGAGLAGVLALVAADRGADQVVGVEANAELVALVRAHVRVDEQELRLIHGAIAASDGTAPFYTSNDWLASSLDPEWAPTLGRKAISVRKYALSRLLHEHDCHGVVLDIEGAEFEALNTVERGWLAGLVCEVHYGDPASRNAALRRMSGTCARLGLTIREQIDGERTAMMAAAPG